MLATLKRFLSAEEVPRWFGFSIVLVYLLGLGAVMEFGVAAARNENARDARQRAEYAVKLLASDLERVDYAAPEVKSLLRRELRAFATTFAMSGLRIVDARRAGLPGGGVVVSLAGADLAVAGPRGAAADAETPDEVFGEVESGAEIFRVAIRVTTSAGLGPVAEAGPRDVAEPTVLFLEAIPSGGRPTPWDSADRARVFTVVLVALGLLFGLFRCLRGQLRGMRRIAEQLTTPRERLEDDLDALRITDTTDLVTQAWNDLIDLTRRLAQTVERSEADRELSAALQKSGGGALAEALHCLPDGIIYITDTHRFEYVNAAARRLLEWAGEPACWPAEPGASVDVAVSNARPEGIGGKVLDLVRGALQSDGTYRSLSEVVSEAPEGGRTGGGELSSYRVRVIALPHAQRFGECVVVIRDVSQQIRAERSREEFVTQVTHELRTPLTNIRAYAETLSSGMFEDPAVVTECYNVITKETRRLSRLIEDILSVSQLDTGSIELRFDTVDLKALLDESVRDVRGLADEKNIDLQLVLPAKLEPVRADRDKLAVVINNLLGNAIKYTPADGNVVVGCQCTKDETAITVKDNGIGIDPSEHARVFEKFARSQDPSIQNESGTGIGLYTAREIVRRHNGEIDLVSEKGAGSTFVVRLPRKATRATSLTTGEPAGRAEEA